MRVLQETLITQLTTDLLPRGEVLSPPWCCPATLCFCTGIYYSHEELGTKEKFVISLWEENSHTGSVKQFLAWLKST